MITYVSIFAIGVMFALGLGLSGMTHPEKVTGFLNIVSDEWDPSLLLVMGGAVTTFFVAQRLILKKRISALGGEFQLPTRVDIDLPLVIGAAIFGIGWGLIGFCPGPAIVASMGGQPLMWIFLVSMSSGMYLFGSLHTRFEREPDGGAGLMEILQARDTGGSKDAAALATVTRSASGDAKMSKAEVA